MFLFDYTFFPKNATSECYVNGELGRFLAALYQNGQLGREVHIASVGDTIRVHGLIPEMESLEPRFSNDYVSKRRADVISASAREPDFVLVGPDADGANNICRCESSPFYVLLTTYLEFAPPIKCGGCRGYVPLYRLPYPFDYTDYSAIIGWEDMFKACDQLYVSSGVGERFGLRQIHNPKSELAQNGIKLCRNLAEKTGKPFYYYLVASTWRNFGSKCPSCGQNWETDVSESLCTILRCEVCGLTSSY